MKTELTNATNSESVEFDCKKLLESATLLKKLGLPPEAMFCGVAASQYLKLLPEPIVSLVSGEFLNFSGIKIFPDKNLPENMIELRDKNNKILSRFLLTNTDKQP